MAVVWISSEACSPIKLFVAATNTMRMENSLICPSLKPKSHARDVFSLCCFNSKKNTVGFAARMTAANINAGNKTLGNSGILSCAPNAKKNNTKKKSRSGRKFNAIYCEIGLVAREMPAINAPISADKLTDSDKCANPKHQPIANKKMYS